MNLAQSQMQLLQPPSRPAKPQLAFLQRALPPEVRATDFESMRRTGSPESGCVESGRSLTSCSISNPPRTAPSASKI